MFRKSRSALGDVCFSSQDAQMVFSPRYPASYRRKYRPASSVQRSLGECSDRFSRYGTITVDNLLSPHMAQKIFINLPVKDLAVSMDFFSKLGFECKPEFTSENGACMVVSESIFVMLLVEGFFQTFTKKEIADATKVTEVLTALSVDSREAVDSLLTLALEAGAEEAREAQDHGFMYARSFEDPDGHIWEIFFMDEKTVAEETKEN